MAAIAKRGRGVPGSGSAPRPVEARDLLADLDEVLGAERVRLADVPALLRERWPQWAPYRQLKGTQLRRLLADAGVRVTNTDNVPRLDPADLRSALPGRTEG
jgi:S-DNA-T family DNA segregation ATPase FtsK/SpoIIIE